MKKITHTLFLILFCFHSYAANITIIESQSFNFGHDMDLKWQTTASSMGHTASILPQTTLDNNSFFGSTDVLIISSGVITLSAARVSTILLFLQSGKPVFLQSEYLASYSTNQAFASMITSMGGTFSWTTPFSGDLNPMTVLGTIATTPNVSGPIPYYWYSVAGSGDVNTIPFLQYGGAYHGFVYHPTNPGYGKLMTTTDQDWIRTSVNVPLMENMLFHLLSSIPLPVELTQFEATKTASGNLLEWTTQYEKNNARFDIERSRDESLSFAKIGSVHSATNPDIENHYSFLDPAPWPGINYYRLKQVDMDGKWTYSKTISVDNSREELIVFPNPANNQIWIGRQSKASTFVITNNAGQTLKSGSTGGDEYIDIHDLPAGIYYLQMNQQTLLFSKK
jgi:hypothetical protein